MYCIRNYLSLPLVALMLMIGSSCGGPKPGVEDWQDPSKTMWLTIESVPTGAEVYGVVDQAPGTLLGRTPLTVKFWRGYRTKEPVFWQCPNQQAPMCEVMNHYFGEAIFLNPGVGPIDKRTWHRVAKGRNRHRETARFHCFVVKEGYKPQLMQDVYLMETGHTDFPNVFKGEKIYNVVLDEDEPDGF